MKNPFTEHPETLNETYLEHMQAALKISGLMLLAGSACLIHSIFPFLFTNFANDTVQRLHKFYESRKAN
jgi:hypothetical protein